MKSPKGFSMKPTRHSLQAMALAALLGVSAQPQFSAPSDVPKVTPPPESFFELINAGGRRVENPDITPHRRLKDIFEKAVAAGKWKGTSAVHDRVQYWTAGVLAYFDALGQDGAPNDAAHPVRTRELLQQYDPDLFTLVHETMAYRGKVDWRYLPYGR